MKKKFVELSTQEQNELFKNHEKKFTLLIEEIAKLKEVKDRPILLVAAFLLEIQEIEFHLLILVTELHFSSLMESGFIKIKENKSELKSKEPYDMTLGELKNEVDKYEAPFLLELQKTLGELNKLRRRYAHHLFTGMDSWDKVIEDVNEGLILNGKTMKELYRVGKIINDKSKFGKLMNKKVEKTSKQ